VTRAAAGALVLTLAVGLTGCSLGGGGSDGGQAAAPTATATGPEAAPAKPRPGEPPEAAQIRGWSRELNAGHFEQAASFFARNAVVEQVQKIRLPNRTAAVAFNKSLPCRADVTDVKTDGATVVAAFRLRPGKGPKSACDSAARVRFRFSRGKFTEWRQLMEPAAPSAKSVQT
jgi:hypothetical protein